MSEFIKPEHECPFDPKQYHCDCFIAPVGSFSWALIQLKLRKRVTRSVWVNCQGDNEMYLAITPRVNNLAVEKDSAYAVDGVAVGTKYDYLTHIDLRNEHGNFVPWQPTQEDMMACDWVLVEDKAKPESESDDMLVFDLNSAFDKESKYYGYLGENRISDMSYKSMGVLTIIKNKTDIKNALIFHSAKTYIHFSVSFDKSNSQKVEELFKKNLYIKVNNTTYDLGVGSLWGNENTDTNYGFLYTFDQAKKDGKKLSEILMKTGETKRFYCNWY
ncbi:DUF2829 domain-containing protein [Xenorhabdus sp. PB30.3]|uniref:DUF2829 domain-containing protein n=1 Tax=Xenorhabdus sp. PB30.3 TaxID=2788941 RepID=UPI001E326346|nr:DUF2829 domain-containing protein [Xenorhabdus sp. PB30.3]MCC8381540.1 DUF2829 domain-containing protein [Xenorhabdus sp. PB30.3]